MNGPVGWVCSNCRQTLLINIDNSCVPNYLVSITIAYMYKIHCYTENSYITIVTTLVRSEMVSISSICC